MISDGHAAGQSYHW